MHSLNRPMVFVAMMLLACSAALAQGGGAGSAMVAGMPPIAAPAIVTDSVQIRFTSPPCFSTIIDSVVVSNGGADPLTVSPRVIGPAATDFVL